MTSKREEFCLKIGAKRPVIGGAMYPCSNPELVAAVSEAGGLGIIQPIALTYAHGYGFAAGLEKILSLTSKAVGMNVIVEKTSRHYERMMRSWVDVALQAGIRFFVTSLGNPRWVCEKAAAWNEKHPQQLPVLVYHDVTSRRWALKAQQAGVDGLIAVNSEAGGHAGMVAMEALYHELAPLGLPLVAAGGISAREHSEKAFAWGYEAIQIGTRLIASHECSAHSAYKQAICDAQREDIMLTERISGVPVAVIATEYAKARGAQASRLGRLLLRQRKTKHFMRTLYALRSLRSLPAAAQKSGAYQGYWQAGKSVEGIDEVLTVTEIMEDLVGPDGGIQENCHRQNLP